MQSVAIRLVLWAVAVGLVGWLLPWWAAVLVALIGFPIATQPWRSSLHEGVDRSRGFVLRESVIKADGLAAEPIDPETLRLRLDLTVRPRPGNARLRPWMPHEFRFRPNVGNEVRAGKIEQRAGAQWVAVTQEPLKGEQQLRLQLVVPKRATSLTIHYFLEELGHVPLGNVAPIHGTVA